MAGLVDHPSPSLRLASDMRNVMSKGCSTLLGVALARNAIPAAKASSVSVAMASVVVSAWLAFSSISESLVCSAASVPLASSVCGVSANALICANISSSSALRSSLIAWSNA